jgi:hypothetical protein
MSYAAYRRTKIESGLCYQDFVVDVLLKTIGLAVVQYSSQFYQQTVGESRTGVEIKHDELYAKTGHFWIEVAEKAVPRPGPYAPSGIDRGDNTWLYVIGNYDTIFIFGKVSLRALWASGRYPVLENHTKTSQGFRLPDAVARKVALVILTPNAERKVASAIRDLQTLGRELHRIAMGLPTSLSLFGDEDEPL